MYSASSGTLLADRIYLDDSLAVTHPERFRMNAVGEDFTFPYYDRRRRCDTPLLAEGMFVRKYDLSFIFYRPIREDRVAEIFPMLFMYRSGKVDVVEFETPRDRFDARAVHFLKLYETTLIVSGDAGRVDA